MGVAGDHITNAGVVTLKGQTEANASVSLLTLGLTTTADDSGAFQFGGVALAEGDNAFTVLAPDAAGNQTSSNLIIPRDTTLPSLPAPPLTNTATPPPHHI